MNNYNDFVTKYHRFQYAPRTMSEAFRDADYGTAIWKCEKPQGWRLDAFIEAIVFALMFGIVGYSLSFYIG